MICMVWIRVVNSFLSLLSFGTSKSLCSLALWRSCQVAVSGLRVEHKTHVFQCLAMCTLLAPSSIWKINSAYLSNDSFSAGGSYRWCSATSFQQRVSTTFINSQQHGERQKVKHKTSGAIKCCLFPSLFYTHHAVRSTFWCILHCILPVPASFPMRDEIVNRHEVKESYRRRLNWSLVTTSTKRFLKGWKNLVYEPQNIFRNDT